MLDTDKLIATLTQKWYSREEIAKIIQWLKDEKNGDVHSAEDVYKSLFSVEKEYA